MEFMHELKVFMLEGSIKLLGDFSWKKK